VGGNCEERDSGGRRGKKERKGNQQAKMEAFVSHEEKTY